MIRSVYSFCFILVLSFSAFGATTKLPSWVSEEPIINFTFPFFEEDGSPKWTLLGHEGRYQEDHTFHVVEMSLKSFQAQDHPDDFLLLESPKAILEIDDERAFGKEGITVTSSQFLLTGDQWTWNAAKDLMTVEKNVKVQFTQPLSLGDKF